MHDYGEKCAATVAPKTPTLMNDISVLTERATNVRNRLADIKGRLFGYEPQPPSTAGAISKEELVGSYATSDILYACRALNDAQEILAAVEVRLG